MQKNIVPFTCFWFLVLWISCHAQHSAPSLQTPVQLNDGLQVTHHNELNLNDELLDEAVTKIRKGRFGPIHSMLISISDRLILEEYVPGYRFRWDARKHRGDMVTWDQNHLHRVMSVTKSITSTCIGIAINQGFIQHIEQSIFDYLPDHQHLKTKENEGITIKHLLTMTSGLEGNEWTSPYSDIENPIIALWFPPCVDPITCVLEKPRLFQPGTHFSYYGGGMIVLGEIIKHASQQPIDYFSQKYLFDPLDIDTVNWAVQFENGVFEAAGGLEMRPRDMLKVGLAFLKEGKWQNQQLLSEEWVKNCSTPYPTNLEIDVPGEQAGANGYAYGWWTCQLSAGVKSIPAFYAGGWGGQKIMIIPELEAVIVLTGGAYTSKVKDFKLLEKYILPALLGA